MINLFVVSCATDHKYDGMARDIAKEDLMKKLELHESTKFNDNDIHIIETYAVEGFLGIIYNVRNTINSQHRKGNEVLKEYIINYKIWSRRL